VLPAVSEAGEEVLERLEAGAELTLVMPPLPAPGADLTSAEVEESPYLRPAAEGPDWRPQRGE
jgi:hypothetical protein